MEITDEMIEALEIIRRFTQETLEEGTTSVSTEEVSQAVYTMEEAMVFQDIDDEIDRRTFEASRVRVTTRELPDGRFATYRNDDPDTKLAEAATNDELEELLEKLPFPVTIDIVLLSDIEGETWPTSKVFRSR